MSATHCTTIAKRAAAALGLLALLAAGAARAAVFKVGDDEPAADFTTIQEAVNAALAVTGSREIRVAAGRYPERVLLLADDLGGHVELSGGWNGDFSSRTLDAGATVVDAATAGSRRVLTLECSAGTLRVEGLTLTGGHTVRGGLDTDAGAGGGAWLRGRGTCSITFEDNSIHANTAEGDAANATQAGGLFATLADASRLRLEDNRIEANKAVNAAGFAASGGATVFVHQDSGASLLGNLIAGNSATGGVGAGDGGMRLSVTGRGLAIAHDNVIARNSVAATNEGAVPLSLGASLDVGQGGDLVCDPCGGEAEWRRNRVEDNRDLGDSGASFHFTLIAARRARVTLSDSIVADAPGSGILALVSQEADVAAVNLTVTGHAGNGIAALVFDPATASLSIANSIFAFDGTDVLPSGITSSANLVGLDPTFVNAAGHDYRLRAGSLGIDAGDNSPPGGLGTSDIDGRRRIIGGRVDKGAHEAENGQCSVTDPLPPADFTNACHCFTDPSLREFRCSFFQADLFVTVRTPWPLLPGQSFEAAWQIQPWSGASGPYALDAAFVVNSKKQSLGSPKASPKLADGKLASVSLETLAPASPTPLRTHILYQRPGDKQWRETELDALLPVETPKP